MEEEEWDWNKVKDLPETLERIEELRLKNLLRDLGPPPDHEDAKEDIPLL